MNAPIKQSLRAAIDAKCKDCIYDPLDHGTWRMQVEACAYTDCPLHVVRPRTRARKCGRNAVKNERSGDVWRE